MKLTDIDLTDKSEVSAAHALLAAILGHAVSDDIPGAPSLNQTTAGMTGEQVVSAIRAEIDRPASQVFAQPATLPAGAQPMQDAAVVFGAAPLAGVPAAGIPASGLPSNGGTSVAPGVAAPIPQALVTAEGAAVGMPSVSGVELDSKGLPWDARIHASTKSKKKDGSWTALRGLNDEGKVRHIEAELRASVAASQGAQLGAIVQAQGAAPLAGNTAALQTMNPAQLPVTNGPASSAGNAQPGAMSLPASGGADPVTFEQLMPRVTQATIAGVLPPTALQQVCVNAGLQSVVALQTNPAYVPHVWAQLKAAFPALQ